MVKDRSARVIALVALLVGVVGLSIGFSSFSDTLTISSSATIKLVDSFDVNFSSDGTTEVAGSVNGTPSVADVTAETATINNTSDPTITGLKATFTEPGQNVVYHFYAHNNGQYKAYLNAVTFGKVAGQSATKVCTPDLNTNATMVASACESINVKVQIGSETYDASEASISDHILDIDAFEDVIVTITYEADGTLADGDFDVAFGDISLVYGSQD